MGSKRKRHDGRRERLKGKAGFETYFGELFGDRWTAIEHALSGASNYTTLKEGLLRPYHLDRASLLPARAVPLEGARCVLDLCAAPGGKSLILARRMPREAQLLANDRSRQRLGRLRRVLQEHLPEELLARVETSGEDAALWGRNRPESADAILADVPCSSERHVLSSPPHLADWSESRVTRLAKQATGILASAFDTLRPGGSVVYSTCALSPEENDAVVARVLQRRKGRCELHRPEGAELEEICAGVLSVQTVEPTERGYQILPDRAEGSGPIYFARLRKGAEL